MEAKYNIHCYNNRVSVQEKYIDVQRELEDDEVKLFYTEKDFTGKNFNIVINNLKSLGFTNIEEKPLSDVSKDSVLNLVTTEILIGGTRNYKYATIFNKDVPIIVKYHSIKPETQTSTEKKDTTTNDTVSYSTNTKDKVKNGNTGVYSYKSRGGTYDNYFIIDFDEGYVYFFSDGNGSDECDRVQIVSGTLNDVVIITYIDGSSTWSEGLHFKYKNQPDHLVLQDANGFEYDYYTTDLKNALKKRTEKL